MEIEPFFLFKATTHPFNVEETISTLQFAKRAKTIKNKVVVNQKRSVEELEQIVSQLTKKLNALQGYSAALEEELREVKGPLWKPSASGAERSQVPTSAASSQDAVDLQLQLEELKRASEQTVAELKEQVAELEEQKALNAQFAERQRVAAEQERREKEEALVRLESLREESEAVKEKLELVHQNLKKSEAESAKLKEQADYSIQKAQQATEALANKSRSEAALQMSLSEAQSKLEKLESSQKFREFEFKQTAEEKSSLESSVQRLEKSNKELREKEETLKDQILKVRKFISLTLIFCSILSFL